ncbi:MAG: hypothetical protein S4CHLAM20_11230 [Chlamydiia bacterium]|nr:hypothetical protein [Chlamydiia bacterium]
MKKSSWCFALVCSFVHVSASVFCLDFKRDNFCINEDYISRNQYCHHDDRKFKDGSQDEVYQIAKKLVEENILTCIYDVGCGSAYKLIKYFSNYQTVGYEIEPTLGFLKDKYPEREWRLSDLSIIPEYKSSDVLICSDVVEHIVNPDDLLNFINRFDFKYLVISTPDRDKLLEVQGKKQSQTGPPVNPAHMREWSFSEFEEYISSYFNVISHVHCEKEYWCQVIIATKK